MGMDCYTGQSPGIGSSVAARVAQDHSCARSLRHAAFASTSGYLENTDHGDWDPGTKSEKNSEQILWKVWPIQIGHYHIGDATTKGPNWQDLSTDFEKGYLKVPHLMDVDAQGPGSAKRTAPEGPGTKWPPQNSCLESWFKKISEWVSEWVSETCMPKQATLSGRRQAQQIEFTFHVHQVSVNERKSSNWLIQKEKFWARSRQFPICLCLQKCWIIESHV